MSLGWLREVGTASRHWHLVLNTTIACDRRLKAATRPQTQLPGEARLSDLCPVCLQIARNHEGALTPQAKGEK